MPGAQIKSRPVSLRARASQGLYETHLATSGFSRAQFLVLTFILTHIPNSVINSTGLFLFVVILMIHCNRAGTGWIQKEQIR